MRRLLLALLLSTVVASEVHAQMAFRSVSSLKEDGTAGTALIPSEPAGAANGDVLLACFNANYLQFVSAPAGWTVLHTGTVVSGTGLDYWVGWIARGGSAPSLTWVTTDGAIRAVHVAAFSGANTSALIDASSDTGSTAASATAPDPPSATATVTPTIAVACGFHWLAPATWTAPTGYTLRGTATFRLTMATKALSATGAEDPAVFGGTPTGTDSRWAATVILKSAAVSSRHTFLGGGLLQ